MPQPERKLLKPESWPAGHRAALAVLVDLDPAQSPWTVPSPFANEAGAGRLITMLADLDIVPTAIIDPNASDRYRLPEDVECDGAAHIAQPPGDMRRARSSAETRLGAEVNGVVVLSGLPLGSIENEAVWLVDGSGSPFPLLTHRNRVVIPYSPWWHDVYWFSPANPSPPSALLEMWSAGLASVRTHGELMTVMLSAEIAGHPGYVEAMQRFFDEAIGAGDVWISNGTAIARHVRPDDAS